MYSKIKIPDEIIVSLYKKMLSVDDDDFYIITYKGKILDVTDSIKILLTTINKNKDVLLQKDYFKLDFYEFCTSFLKDTNKYKTYHNFTVYKYNIHLEKLKNFANNKNNRIKPLPSYLQRFVNLLKEKECKQFIRKQKIERLINSK